MVCQVDVSVVRSLCQQHGTVQFFQLNSSARQALVTFSTPDEAAAAQRALSCYLLAGMTLSVEFIPDTDVTQLSSSVPTDLAASLSRIWSAVPSCDVNQQSVWHSAGGGGVWGSSAGHL